MNDDEQQPLTRDDLLAALRDLASDLPGEGQHIEADDLLLRYINDPEITAAFEAIAKWYAK